MTRNRIGTVTKSGSQFVVETKVDCDGRVKIALEKKTVRKRQKPFGENFSWLCGKGGENFGGRLLVEEEVWPVKGGVGKPCVATGERSRHTPFSDVTQTAIFVGGTKNLP